MTTPEQKIDEIAGQLARELSWGRPRQNFIANLIAALGHTILNAARAEARKQR